MNKLDEILSETKCDLENIKSIFRDFIMEKCVIDGLRWAGYLDEVVEVEIPRNGVPVGAKISKRGADLVKSLLDGKELSIVLAYFVSPEYYCRLALLLKNSYNYYYGDERWSFKDVMCKHFFILEDDKFFEFRETISGVKYITNEEFLMKKFDLVVSNPPYNIGMEHGVDLKIHKVLEETAKKIVFVHPSRFMLTHKPGVKPIVDLDMKKFETVHMFWANGVFGIGLYTPICVTTWNSEKDNKEITVIDDGYTNSIYTCDYNKVHIYGKEFSKLLNWANEIDMSMGRLGKLGKTIASTDFAFYLSTMRGTPPRGAETKVKDDFFTIVPKENDKIKTHFVKQGYTSGKYKVTYSFTTKDELDNFVNYLKTKSVRFILSLSKTANALCDGELNQIPWMDFTRSYSDKDLCKMWNIDDKLWKFIDEHIPAYYPDWHFDGIY